MFRKDSRIELLCEVCLKKFKVYPYRSKLAKTCGVRCRSNRHSLNNGGQTQSKGWVAKNGYRYVAVRGKHTLEHRFVVEKYYGIKLKPNQVVHHKNHNRTDNRIENLEILDKSIHARMHINEVKPWSRYAL